MPSSQHRITQGDDYRRIMRQGRRVGGQFVVTHAVLRSLDEPVRFGYIVSKKVGNAVVRNLVTRRLKSISDDLIRHEIAGLDVVFRALPAAGAASYEHLCREVFAHMERIGAGAR